MKLEVFNIEVTRKCNMSCKHCMRGDAQAFSVDIEKLEHFLVNNEITNIRLLNFVGGEPTLALDELYAIREMLNELNIEVGSFFMYINGKEIPRDFIEFCMQMYLYCTKNNETAIIVSQSDWHEEYNKEQFDRLAILKFVGFQNKLTEENLVKEGRAKDFGKFEVVPHKYKLENNTLIGKELVFNAKGDIIPGCDFSYNKQEEVKLGDYKMKLGEYSW